MTFLERFLQEHAKDPARSGAEIARALGIPPGNARGRAYEVAQELRGRCRRCSEPIGPSSTVYCEEHHRKRLESDRIYRDRRKEKDD